MLLPKIDYSFWLKKNEYYSDEILSNSVEQGLNHAAKAGLVGKYIEHLKTNKDLINLIEEKIKQKKSPNDYSDKDLLTIFDLIQGWGGRTGRSPYVQPKGKPYRMNDDTYPKIYREAIEMLYKTNKESEYDEILQVKPKIEELKGVGESFSTKHLSFWSRFLDNCPPLAIFDKRMKNIFYASNNSSNKEITYKNFLKALQETSKSINLEIYEIEAAIFGFSENYFKNEEIVLINEFEIDHEDVRIAKELIS